jgi:tetratricopeptide (TPR) repeat protein
VFGAKSPPLASVRLSLALQRTRTGQLGRAIAAHFQKPPTDAASWAGMQMFLENQVAPDAPARAIAHRHFESNLSDILDAGLESNARIILNTMAVNLRECPPFAAVHSERVSAADRGRFEALMAAGRKFQSETNWTEAARHFAAAAELSPTRADAHYQHAVCLQSLGEEADAGSAFQRACDLDALPFRADGPINEAIRRQADRRQGAPLRLLASPDLLARESGVRPCGHEAFYEHVHFNFDGAYWLGRGWALAVAEALPDLLPAEGHEWASQQACEEALALTDWNRKLVFESVARRFQQPPLSEQSNNAGRLQGLQQRGQHLLAGMNQGTLARARATYESAIAAQPDDHFLHEVQGNFLQVSGDLVGATRAWRRCAELMPHDFLPRFQAGVLLARQQHHAEAQEELRAALRMRPSLAEGWMELARSYEAEQKWSPALQALQRVLAFRPTDPFLRANEARLLVALNRRAEAVAAYQRALQANPGLADVRVALGDLYLDSGQPGEAYSQYEAALRARPDFARAHLQLGLLLSRQGQAEAARDRFREVLRLEPGNAVALEAMQRLEARAR